MPYLTDILIVRGILPIEHLDRISADEDDEPLIRDLVAKGIVTEVQFASARAEKLSRRPRRRRSCACGRLSAV